MDNKEILAKLFLLYYREGQMTNKSYDSTEYIKQVMAKVIIPEPSVAIIDENFTLGRVKELILRGLRDNNLDTDISKLSSLQLACSDNPYIYKAIEQLCLQEVSPEDLPMHCHKIKSNIDSILNEAEIVAKTKAFSNKLVWHRGSIENLANEIAEFTSTLQSLAVPQEEAKDPAIMSEIDITTGEGTEEVLSQLADEASGLTTFKFPWQALNRMTRGGLRRKTFTTVAALRYNCKSGFCLATCVGGALYNNPKEAMSDPEKKPLILFISLENDNIKSLGDTYKLLKENLDNEYIDDAELAKLGEPEKVKLAAKYIAEKTSSQGYSFRIIRVNPSEWTYMDFFRKIEAIEREGYEIHLCCVDYLNMLPKIGCDGSTEAAKIRDMFRKVRNFMVKKNIAFLTPHQLSRDAEELVRQGRKDLVKLVSAGSYYADSTLIAQEIDLEIYLHIVKENLVSYLTIQRGKHRGIGEADPKDLYAILPFQKVGGIRFDYDSHDSSVEKFGQTRNENGELENPFWMPPESQVGMKPVEDEIPI